MARRYKNWKIRLGVELPHQFRRLYLPQYVSATSRRFQKSRRGPRQSNSSMNVTTPAISSTSPIASTAARSGRRLLVQLIFGILGGIGADPGTICRSWKRTADQGCSWQSILLVGARGRAGIRCISGGTNGCDDGRQHPASGSRICSISGRASSLCWQKQSPSRWRKIRRIVEELGFGEVATPAEAPRCDARSQRLPTTGWNF